MNSNRRRTNSCTSLTKMNDTSYKQKMNNNGKRSNINTKVNNGTMRRSLVKPSWDVSIYVYCF
jgi:hypothetical protein